MNPGKNTEKNTEGDTAGNVAESPALHPRWAPAAEPRGENLAGTGRERLLFYCQHSVGMGHLVRSLVLAGELAQRFDVVLLSGGEFPSGMSVPAGVQVVPLPPLGLGEDYALVSRNADWTVEQAQQERVRQLLGWLEAVDPQALLVELYPFGRRKFAFELLPLLDAAARRPRPPAVICSVRDILVQSRRDQLRHDEQASQVANRYFDAVLVHADPQFARFEESFAPTTPLSVPVHYTGFVRRKITADSAAPTRAQRVLVSAGGGMVGGPLFAAAVEAAPALLARDRLLTTIVTGPFLPEVERIALRRRVSDSAVPVTILDYVPDLAELIAGSAVSVSQCGYNTTMDLLTAETPAVVVPYAEGREDEQLRRARRLESLGLVTVLEPGRMSGPALVEAVRAAHSRTSVTTRLQLNGAERTRELVGSLVTEQRTGRAAAG